MFNHSEECTVPLVEHQSSRAVLAMGSSWSLFQFPLRILDKIFCFMPVSSTSSRAHTARNSGLSQKVTYLFCDELEDSFKRAYE